ncbi:MAG: Asp/Glu/hydantoin racemase [Alphaproteobacteria bacterium]|nr:Asp/Glu/hydantoin racemase [Alphaproteobacteria bacterium]
MAKQLAFVHTVPGLVSTFADLAQARLPDWETFNIVDESLLRNTIRSRRLTEATMRRVAGHVLSAVDAGADAVLVTCSSIGPAVDATRPFCPVPLFRIDEEMADRAIAAGARIGVLATLSSTLEPTRELVARRAAMAGKPVAIRDDVCAGAFEALQRGDRDGHDAAVRAAVGRMLPAVDVIVLAQASMARVLESMPAGSVQVPVLTSPGTAMERVAAALSGA